MRELVTEGVPARVVIAGTSTMRLNDRFSKLPARKTIQKSPRPAGRSRSIRQVLPYNDFEEDDFDDVMDTGTVRYASPRATRSLSRGNMNYRRGIVGRVTVPISHRLTAQPRTKFIYVNPPNRGFTRGARRGTGNFNKFGQNFQNNNFNNSRGGFRGRGGFFGNRGRGGRGFHQNNSSGHFNTHNKQNEKKSVAELDRELDDYMRKQKHPRIIA